MKVKAAKNKLSVEGSLIFDNAEQLKEELLATLENLNHDKPVTIDFSKVEEIDSSGIQLLISLFKTMESNRIRYKMESISEEMAEILELSGLKKYFTN